MGSDTTQIPIEQGLLLKSDLIEATTKAVYEKTRFRSWGRAAGAGAVQGLAHVVSNNVASAARLSENQRMVANLAGTAVLTSAVDYLALGRKGVEPFLSSVGVDLASMFLTYQMNETAII